ncbi:MAG: hypothetical protein EAX95_07935 [Candidatus Thorarchaeota archaeon]|nr:hypothetical protein [Candidatus Thorarchaeota archaeon]
MSHLLSQGAPLLLHEDNLPRVTLRAYILGSPSSAQVFGFAFRTHRNLFSQVRAVNRLMTLSAHLVVAMSTLQAVIAENTSAVFTEMTCFVLTALLTTKMCGI